MQQYDFIIVLLTLTKRCTSENFHKSSREALTVEYFWLPLYANEGMMFSLQRNTINGSIK